MPLISFLIPLCMQLKTRPLCLKAPFQICGENLISLILHQRKTYYFLFADMSACLACTFPQSELLQKVISGGVNNAVLLPTGTEHIEYRSLKCLRYTRKVIGGSSNPKNKRGWSAKFGLVPPELYGLLRNACSWKVNCNYSLALIYHKTS